MISTRDGATLTSPILHGQQRRHRATWHWHSSSSRRAVGALGRRGSDLLFACAAILLLSPLLVIRALRSGWQEGRTFDRSVVVGRFREPFQRLRFAGSGRGRDLAVLWNLLRGDLSLVGPRALAPEEADSVPPEGMVRFVVRPGLVSRHAIQRQTGIAYDAEAAIDCEHYYQQSLASDLGLLIRSVPARILARTESAPPPPFLDFFGVTIVNTTMDEAVRWVESRARRTGHRPTQLAFVNPDCLNIAYTNDSYRDVLRGVDRILPDGIGIHIGCRLLGTSLRANVNGTDLFPRLCERFAVTGQSIYLLGARPGVAAAAATAMQERYPGLRIAGTRDGYFARDEEGAVIEEIRNSGASVLLAAFGVPRQELWLAEHRDALNVPVMAGVGGLFDFYSGRIQRAPAWLREIGMEWAWRLLQEPGRMWRRYLVGNWVFLYRVWKQGRSSVGARPQRVSQ